MGEEVQALEQEWVEQSQDLAWSQEQKNCFSANRALSV
jgi:hypothetical protein